MEQKPKRRGRPKKDAPKKVTVDTPKQVQKQDNPTENKVTYNHLRYQRCGTKMNTASHPTFLHDNMVCNHLMTPIKTTDNGRYKHYKCAFCGSTRKVEGDLV